MKTKEEIIAEVVKSKVANTCHLPAFFEWVSGQSLNPGDLILINNSFLYREKVSTTKSSKYLSLQMRDSSLENADVKIAETTNVNLDFKYYSQRATLPSLIPLAAAIQEELLKLGPLIFILIGEVDDSQEFSQTINHGMFENVIYRPQLDEPLVLEGRSIVINELTNTELLWRELTKEARRANLIPDELPAPLLTAFEATIKELRKNCYLNLKLPIHNGDLKNVFVDSIISSLKQNAHEYRESLEKCSGDQSEPQEFNNILRIAYNFAGEAVTMLKLMVKICDLKPLLLWMTIKEQIELLQAFRNLPDLKIATRPAEARVAEA